MFTGTEHANNTAEAGCPHSPPYPSADPPHTLLAGTGRLAAGQSFYSYNCRLWDGIVVAVLPSIHPGIPGYGGVRSSRVQWCRDPLPPLPYICPVFSHHLIALGDNLGSKLSVANFPDSVGSLTKFLVISLKLHLLEARD